MLMKWKILIWELYCISCPPNGDVWLEKSTKFFSTKWKTFNWEICSNNPNKLDAHEVVKF